LGGAGVWSLVAQLLTVSIFRVLIMWTRSPWRPNLSFDPSAIRELIRFGGHLTGFGAVVYWSSNVDKLVIGRSIGSAALGVYSLADRLMRLPTIVTEITTSVMFPALSSIQNEQESVQRAYLRGIGMVALITCPMMIGLSVLAQPAILLVYGSQWHASIPILQLLCYAGMAQSIYNTAVWIFLSHGRADLLLRLGIYSTAVRTIGVLIGAHWGLIGVAWAYLLGTYLLVWYPTWATAARLIGLDLPALLRQVVGPFSCAAVMGAVLWLSDRSLLEGRSMLLRLGLQVPFAALLYLMLIKHSRLRAWNDTRAMLLELSGGRSRLLRWILS
jgi:O-antigen/teichoic acid export membrane protein